MKFFSEVFGWMFERYSQFIDNSYFRIITGEVGTHGINGCLLYTSDAADE